MATTVNATWPAFLDEYMIADGEIYAQIAEYVTPQYLVEGSDGKWTWSPYKPRTGGYVDNYPLPLPYFATFESDGNGSPKINSHRTQDTLEISAFQYLPNDERFLY